MKYLSIDPPYRKGLECPSEHAIRVRAYLLPVYHSSQEGASIDLSHGQHTLAIRYIPRYFCPEGSSVHGLIYRQLGKCQTEEAPWGTCVSIFTTFLITWNGKNLPIDRFPRRPGIFRRYDIQNRKNSHFSLYMRLQ